MEKIESRLRKAVISGTTLISRFQGAYTPVVWQTSMIFTEIALCEEQSLKVLELGGCSIPG